MKNAKGEGEVEEKRKKKKEKKLKKWMGAVLQAVGRTGWSFMGI